jgi:intracellular sulfur oxidation DsrE/DsrF family protein
MKILKVVSLAIGLSALMFGSIHAYASDDHDEGNKQCPVGLLNGLTLDAEFGAGVADLTRCLTVRHNLKVAVEINRRCRSWADSSSSGACSGAGPDALGNMTNVLNDYDITHGMVPGRDYQMIAIVHGGGGYLLLNDATRNPYVDAIKGMMARGVTFYFCQNTVRGFIRSGALQNPQTTGISVKDQLIPGVRYVTAGFSAVADVQQLGWSVITP